jgi:hypothetical protein
MVRNVMGDPPAPDVPPAFEAMGYKGMVNYHPKYSDN